MERGIKSWCTRGDNGVDGDADERDRTGTWGPKGEEEQ
jgi:hypothetical protein